MFSNYLKVALRNILKYKGYSFINIVGLGVGMAVCILIALWVFDEFSYDKFHDNEPCLHRITTITNSPEHSETSALTPVPLGPTIKAEIPEIIRTSRFNIEGPQYIKYKQKTYYNDVLALADPDFLKMFSFPLISGNHEIVLADRFSVVISESMSRKYFGTQDPVGQVLNINRRDFTITGIMKNLPHNTHFEFDCLAPFDSRHDRMRQLTDDRWDVSAYYSYIQLNEFSSLSDIITKINETFHRNCKTEEVTQIIGLQPITDIHLGQDVHDYLENHGDMGLIYVLISLAVVVLVAACVNYINLTVARGTLRAREIGIRKVIGAQQANIFYQLMVESFLSTTVAILLALCAVELCLPIFNRWCGKELNFLYSINHLVFLGILGVTALSGLLSGLYPAFSLSASNPTKALKGQQPSNQKGISLRKIMVAGQFIISISLITCAIIIYNQLDFIRNRELDFNPKNLFYMDMRGDFRTSYFSIKQKLLSDPAILNVTAGKVPIMSYSSAFNINANGKEISDELFISQSPVDYDYITTYDMQLIAGRTFSLDNASDVQGSLILNQTAVNLMDLEDPVGATLSFSKYDQTLEVQNISGTIIGVVKDFHHRSLQNKIEPIVMYYSPHELYCITIRSKPGLTSNALAALRNEWEQYSSEYPFDYFFINDAISSFYQSDYQFMEIFYAFTTIAIVISCLGLFGLTTFTVERRTKEIGIRKVLGATVTGIVKLLTKEFILLVVVANIVAWPIAYYAMNRWLENFAYRIELGPTVFILAGLAALVIALLTVSFQAIRAATANPVESLRYE